MKIKTSELIGAALDWAVAVCDGYECQFEDEVSGPWLVPQEGFLHDEKPLSRYSPSTNWAQGGPLLEEELMQVFNYAKSSPNEPWFVEKKHFGRHHKAGRSYAEGPTILIAAMRCLCASRLGDEVEIPKDLMT